MGLIKSRSFDAILEPPSSLQFYLFIIWIITFYEDDHLTEEEQDVDGESVLETRPEEQEHIDDNRNSETEHEGEESESIDHYHRSVREKRGMSVDDEYELDDLPFQNVPYYFPAINTDTAEVEDTAPEHFQYSQQHELGTENKKASGHMDDKSKKFYPSCWRYS